MYMPIDEHALHSCQYVWPHVDRRLRIRGSSGRSPRTDRCGDQSPCIACNCWCPAAFSIGLATGSYLGVGDRPGGHRDLFLAGHYDDPFLADLGNRIRPFQSACQSGRCAFPPDTAFRVPYRFGYLRLSRPGRGDSGHMVAAARCRSRRTQRFEAIVPRSEERISGKVVRETRCRLPLPPTPATSPKHRRTNRASPGDRDGKGRR